MIANAPLLARGRGLGRRLLADRAGSPSVDFALTMPALVLMTVGVLQLGMAFLANAGLRNAVESGARYATIYSTTVNTTNACGSTGYPTSDQITAEVIAKAFGMQTSSITASATTPVKDTASGKCYVDITASYPVRFNFIFFSTPAMTLSYSRRAWQM